jgi:Zn-dependent protease with chaperone function
LLIGLIALASAGCGTAGGESGWIRRQGGITSGTWQARAEVALSRLALPADARVHVQVLGTDAVGAYGWPDGNVFVTRGLVGMLNEPELTAALAHEMGHLLDGGYAHGVVSLRGCTSNADAEVRADAIGVRLLQQTGIPSSAMSSMLSKVCASAALPSSCRAEMRQRIAAVSAASSQN